MSMHRIHRPGVRAAGIVAIAAGLMLGASPGLAQAPAGDGKPAVVKDFEQGQKPGAKTKGAPGAKTKAAPEAGAEPGAKAKARKSTVKLSFTTVPRVSARVYYGRKLLGTTPFSVDWPRDSGPVDVVVRAGGYLPVNTRAYTFRDDDVSVSLTRPASASKLLGYKAPVAPEPDEDEEGEDDEGEGDEDAPTSPKPASPAPTSPAPASPAPAVP